MPDRTNELGQPIGAALPGWTPRQRPPRTPMEGRFCRVVPLDPAAHAPDLHAAYAEDHEARMWTYMAHGPFASADALEAWMRATCLGDDPLVHAIVDNATGRAIGAASFMRIEPAVGVIEVGSITYPPRLQRTAMATEVMYLMMRRVFDELGYRRYEWKCDSLNEPSRRAAARLGFVYEGLFRQATVYKGRNRDTAWFSILDTEWPALEAAFEAWLAPGNFDDAGRQRRALGDLIAERRA
ncbi:MAG: GNAT family N-acetyltransferase [Alphaproteobacteria bacterium]